MDVSILSMNIHQRNISPMQPNNLLQKDLFYDIRTLMASAPFVNPLRLTTAKIYVLFHANV